MAAKTPDAPFTRDAPAVAPLPERASPALSWGAVFAGAFVSVGVWILLHLLGVGIGLAAVSPDDPGTLRGVGIGTGIWSVIAPILALFVGGLVVGRLAGPLSGLTGAIHGTVMWSLSTIVSGVLVFMAVTAVLRTAVQAGTEVVATTAEAAPANLGALGLDAQTLVAPINERLAAEGRPTITAQQVEAAAERTLQIAAREGRLDQEVLVTAIAQETNLSRQDAAEIAGTIEQEFTTQVGQVGEQIQETALGVVEDTGRAMIILFVAMLLGLLAAITGATLGVRNVRKRTTRHVAPPRGEVAVAR